MFEEGRTCGNVSDGKCPNRADSAFRSEGLMENPWDGERTITRGIIIFRCKKHFDLPNGWIEISVEQAEKELIVKDVIES